MGQEIIIAAITGLATIVLTIVSQIALWQRKEYRWDRMRVYMTSQEGIICSAPALVAWLVFLALGWVLLVFDMTNFASAIGWASLAGVAIFHVARISRQGIIRPDPTPKAIVLTGIVMAAAVFYLRLFNMAGYADALQWATAIFFIPIIVALGVAAVNTLSSIRKRQIINQAANRRAQLSHLQVVGITGSWGKTSTKHFLLQLLSGSGLKVAATKEHRNSEFTVARDILERLCQKTDVYIAEMGAYRKGEIAALSKLAQPTIGIITAIGNQHVALFGSQENILNAKWELAAALPRVGRLVLNADDPFLAKQGKTFPRVRWFSATGKADVYASAVIMQPTQLQATLHINGDTSEVTIPLASGGMLLSVLAAVTAAHVLGMPSGKIFQAVEKLKAYPKTMEILTGKNGSVIIDDGYSASEGSVKNALDHLERFTEKDKRVVIVPLIELGNEAAAVHKRIGRLLAESRARCFIFGEAHRYDLRHGLRGGTANVTWFTNAKKLAEEVSDGLTGQSVVLLEGRIPDVVRKAVVSY